MLDKAVSVLAAVESGPATLAQLVAATGLARPTTHRIAVALEHHRLLARDVQGRFVLGPRVAELASAAGEDRLLAVSQPVLVQLRDLTGESAQLYRLAGSRGATDVRVCVAAAERASGLRDTVPVGAALPMTAGSAAQVLLAWEEGERMHRGLRGAKFTATALAAVRRRGWAASAAERELGVASVSAPVRGAGGKVLAAVSVSGPIERLTRSPGRLHAPAVVSAGERIGELLRADSSARPLAKLYATVYGRRQRLVCAFSHDRSARKRKRAAKRGPAGIPGRSRPAAAARPAGSMTGTSGAVLHHL